MSFFVHFLNCESQELCLFDQSRFPQLMNDGQTHMHHIHHVAYVLLYKTRILLNANCVMDIYFLPPLLGIS